MLLITGGAGFIGGNFAHHWCSQFDEPLIIVDKLTYAGNRLTIESLCKTGQVYLVEGDICDANLITTLFEMHRPRALIHFAAESHVDRSIWNPGEFIQTNILGTYTLLESTRQYLRHLPFMEKEAFRFFHISTDEVFGSLNENEPSFTEETPYAPNSPYSASKASSDHIVRAYYNTYGVPTLITNCSNNYGPYQSPEKLIPLMILNAIEGKQLPIYGNGENIRDWLYVGDHCAAISELLKKGVPGETYNIGGNTEISNIDVVKIICNFLDDLNPKPTGSYIDQIAFVDDRPGHDKRYAINSNKIQQCIGWCPTETIHTGMQKTIKWYLDNPVWIASSKNIEYEIWLMENYKNRPVLRA